MRRWKKLPFNDIYDKDQIKGRIIDLEVLLQSYIIVIIKYIELNIQYNEVMLEISNLWSYIHSLSIVYMPNSLFHFLYNTIQFIFEYFVNNNVISNDPIVFPFHECINMFMNETVIYNYSEVVLHYIKMISSLLSHTQYEIQQQNHHQQQQQQQTPNSEENSFNNDEISDLDISLLIEDNDDSYQSLLDKCIIDDLYPNYNSLLRALINNIAYCFCIYSYLDLELPFYRILMKQYQYMSFKLFLITKIHCLKVFPFIPIFTIVSNFFRNGLFIKQLLMLLMIIIYNCYWNQ